MIAGITEKEQKIIEHILDKYRKDYAFFYYGSRVKGTYEKTSDLDVLIKGKAEMPLAILQEIKEEFDKSDLPYIVNFSDYYKLDSSFYERIKPDLIPYNWQEVKLGDVCLFIDYRGKTPHKTTSGIPLITAKIVKNGRINEATEFISLEEYKARMTRGLPNIGDILITTEAPMGEVAELKNDKVAIGQRIITLRPQKNILNNRYLKYFLQSNIGRNQLRARESGTTVTGIKSAELKQISIYLPPLEVQKKIAGVLGALDDKIELNNKINQNLEAQAQALFKSWFVDFEPFGGKIPDDWKEINLSDIAEFIGGYSYKSSELQSSSTVMATIKNFDRQGGFKLDGFKEISPSEKLKENQKISLFDTLVAHTDLTQNADVIGNAEMLLSTAGYSNVIISMDVVKVIPKKGISKFLLATLLKDNRFKQHCLGYINGTTVLHLSKKALPEYTFAFPNNMTDVAKLTNILEYLYKKLAYNIEENLRLVELRDTLLPKLMSGEIDVDSVKID